MDQISLISQEKLLYKMKELSEIYDIVRLVDPHKKTVLVYENNVLKEEEKEPCFSFWNREESCSNCVSVKACIDNHRTTKFEFKKDEIYSVVAFPYEIENQAKTVSLELINKVQNDLILQSDGLDRISQQIIEMNHQLYKDSLTGAYNRRYFDEFRFIYEMSHTMPRKIGFIFIDIIQFRELNDLFGHTHCDEILSKVYEVLKASVRNSDRIVRISGDKFLLIMRDCDKLFMEKKSFQIKHAIAIIKFPWMTNFLISVAIGMSFTNCFSGKQDELFNLFDEADKRMILDKKSRENKYDKIAVLIVDDIEMNRNEIKDMIKDSYLIFEASDGFEAFDIISKNHIDLIITDIFMDKMNGYELMAKVKSFPEYRDIPIIAITSKDEASQKKAVDSGADIYVERPIGGFYLLEIIKKMIGKDHGRKELFDMNFVLETIPGAIVIYKKTETKLEVLSCSRGITQLTGWNSEEFSSLSAEQNIKSIFHSDMENFKKTFDHMINTHSRGEIIYRFFKKDGSLVWIWFQGRYIGEENGCPIVEAILLDVSNNTNMYQSIIDESSSAITVVDANTFEVLYVNKRAEELVGLEQSKYVGHVCYECVFHRTKPCDFCICHKRNKNFMDNELVLGEHTFHQIFKRISWHGVDAFLEFSIDITAEKQNIEYSERQKNFQTQILNNIPVGIIVYCWKNNELSCVAANKNLCNMMKLDKEKLLKYKNDDFLALTYPDDIEKCKDELCKLYTPMTETEYDFRSFDRMQNKYIWMNGHGISDLQPDGSVYIYLAYRDITEKRKLDETQRTLFQTKKMAEAKADFYSRMSHDMRTPMNCILGISELAQQSDDISSLHSDLIKIEESGRYMLQLINDTLDYQRMESHRLQLVPEIVSKDDLVKNLLEMLLPAASAKHIDLVVDTGGFDSNCYVNVDSIRLKQIVVNLLSNAIKFTPEGGKVRCVFEDLDIEEDIIHEKLTFSDTGIGMSSEFICNGLFKPFSQEQNELSMQNVGSGLGLSIVKSLIDMMDGSIQVESELGKGTTFTVFLDFEKVDSNKATDYFAKKNKEIQAKDVNLKGKRILLCEDTPLNAEIVKRILERVGAEIDWAIDGIVGFKKFEQSEIGFYSAVLMDIRMPNKNGLETAKDIRVLKRSDATTVPIIAMSANAYDEDIKKSKEAGMNAHLAKPVEIQKLYETLNFFINK